ncbi:hypothetical protein QE152_g39209 [Popillia japonica]|uniref:Uncharacterized protein n=1 Tax=Popillia japonica TaxID=7064 RepID=A0AAW1HUG2_POPJA
MEQNLERPLPTDGHIEQLTKKTGTKRSSHHNKNSSPKSQNQQPERQAIHWRSHEVSQKVPKNVENDRQILQKTLLANESLWIWCNYKWFSINCPNYNFDYPINGEFDDLQ